MPGYRTRQVRLRFGAQDYDIRALSDRQQFADPGGQARRAGISSANWSLFGQVWPAGKLLAEAMCTQALAGERILELGCGLGLASLVLSRRGADITASDHHPLAREFLAFNAAANGFDGPAYRDLPWEVPDADLGRFSLLIASDVLYERGQSDALAGVISRHARPRSRILVTDPGRGNSARLAGVLAEQGFDCNERRAPMDADDVPPHRGRLLAFSR